MHSVESTLQFLLKHWLNSSHATCPIAKFQVNGKLAGS
ncbi:hypothetical protein DICVIV_10571, partial [Dictyocaulus viviparus]